MEGKLCLLSRIEAGRSHWCRMVPLPLPGGLQEYQLEEVFTWGGLEKSPGFSVLKATVF